MTTPTFLVELNKNILESNESDLTNKTLHLKVQHLTMSNSISSFILKKRRRKMLIL